jgi:para-aminobenzoate synthetase component I
VTVVGPEPVAHLGGLVACRLSEVSDDLSVLDRGGRWAVALPYDGSPVLARFDRWSPGTAEDVAGPWRGPNAWETSLQRDAYVAAVERVRGRIADGEVYQANVCRVLSGRLPDPDRCDVAGLHALLSRDNPAPHSAMIRIPGVLEMASASPELFLAREGDVIETGPIKGTGRTAGDLLPKDRAENVMIVDLMRNDLSRVCRTGSVSVPALLEEEAHPGLVHLVSRVRGILGADATWAAILEATFPPGSVTGAPKIAAMQAIADVETVSRGLYCGALGWVDADARTASLAVAIRTFWLEGGAVKFGTGAGITWSSDPEGEWAETELKADRLTAIAGGTWPGRIDA